MLYQTVTAAQTLGIPGDSVSSVEEYASRIQQVCGAFRVHAQAGRADRICGLVESRRLARFEAAVVSLDASRVERDQAMIRRDPGEHLFLLFQHAGSSRIIQRDCQTVLRAGDVYIADSGLPSEFIYEGTQSRQISLHLPRDEAVRRLGSLCTGGMAVDRTDPLVPAMQGIVTRLMLDDAGGAALSEALLNILSAYCHSRATGETDRAAQLHRRAIERIATRAGDGGLDLDTLAGDLGVSRRTLQRAFTRQGESVTGALLAARLDLARSRLGGACKSDRGDIAAIAFDCGFNDLSHFYRAFRMRFGMSPGQARH
ncbi:helix-turn-helix domain-containing protein [Paracoccus sp. PAR01]|uniref:helix-turn-helix domain-containing protein n=1 Tax=Paracoccus sp. PAR01 TaxID=2769282 RepID=UPI00177C89C9|nr:helix-turn-helix domain-containing protein [Paracoccus sp. PAR01]MBD9527312.1 helix-turn-helix domain-containing protein [Paracoccus sp. PAR01]